MTFTNLLKRLFPGAKSTPDVVRFYDFESRGVVELPAENIKPEYMQAYVDGVEGVVWVDSTQVKQAEIRHPPFDEEVRDYIRHIAETFAEHRDLSIEQWEEGFRRDRDPVQEIALWAYAAGVYNEFTEQERCAHRRHDVYRCIVACLSTAPGDVWRVYQPSALQPDEAADVVKRFFGGVSARAIH